MNSVTAAGAEASVQSELLAETSGLLSDTKVALQKLIDLDKKSEEVPEGTELAHYFHEEIVPVMAELRAPVDALEMIVDKEMWPMPSYGDLMFEV